MSGPLTLTAITNRTPFVHCGPVLTELLGSQSCARDYATASLVVTQPRERALEALDLCHVRGRAGGGFPVAHKWWIVAREQSEPKYFICNITAVQPGSFKERFLINANSHSIVESVIIATYLCAARLGLICISSCLETEATLLQSALAEAYECGYLGDNALRSGHSIDVQLVRAANAYVAGEETALMECIEGRQPQPRGKPPLPTRRGLGGQPTAVNNLESLLQARYALRVGHRAYRSLGVETAPGTMVFSLSGDVRRPGLYELPLGTTARELVFEHGLGLQNGDHLQAIIPGISSPIIPANKIDTPLEFESMRDIGSSLGSGCVMVLAGERCMASFTAYVADFFSKNSCGKCAPCAQGTTRAHRLLMNLDRLDQAAINGAGSSKGPHPNSPFTIIGNRPGISYTDTVKGLTKIDYLCEFFKYRGDCHYSTEAANSIQSLVKNFEADFDFHVNGGHCKGIAHSGSRAPATSGAAVCGALP